MDMISFNRTARFRYDPNTNTDGDNEFSGILEIYVHHARNIHNICIYNNQDVYAKFSLTYNPDETLSTRIIVGGGKNPEFNENLIIKVKQFDAVLKCEMWMMSRAKNLMEDQLLGFALVPVSLVAGKGRMTQDFSLSSTDLFHSPAGTVRLTLSLATDVSNQVANPSTTISSEVVLLGREIAEVGLGPMEYSRIEFPDVNIVRENQQMVSEYFDLVGPGPGPGSFLCLGGGGCSNQADDYEMVANSSEDNPSPSGSIQNSGFFSSTMTSLSNDRNSSADSLDKKNILLCGSTSNGPHNNVSITTDEANDNQSPPRASPDTPTSKKEVDAEVTKEEKEPKTEDNKEIASANDCVNFGQQMVFSAEQTVMQQQIVDMYMRSMHQFTESLAKMKLPMDLVKLQVTAVDEDDRGGDVIQNHNNNNVELEKNKKDGSRVFYGSRAFF